MTRTSSSKCPPALSLEEESKGRVARTINLETNRVPHHAGFARGVFESASLACLVSRDYLLMSSFASSRLSKGCRNGFVASGAPLIACVISLAAVGKSPLFDEMRASARWLIQ